MNDTPAPGPDFVNYDKMERKAHQLLDAVDVYQRFEDEELYNQEELPSEVEGYVRELDEESLEEGISPGIILANEIKDMTMDLEQVVAQYTDQHRPANGQKDWQELMDETKEARTATRRAYEAGYDSSKLSPETDSVEEGYTVPKEMSVARLIHNDTKAQMPETSFHHSGE